MKINSVHEMYVIEDNKINLNISIKQNTDVGIMISE